MRKVRLPHTHHIKICLFCVYEIATFRVSLVIRDPPLDTSRKQNILKYIKTITSYLRCARVASSIIYAKWTSRGPIYLNGIGCKLQKFNFCTYSNFLLPVNGYYIVILRGYSISLVLVRPHFA
jgi:hypothetical protein